MTITQVGTDQSFAFADGNGGHACAFGSDPLANDWDVIRVASNTVVNAPSGFTSLVSRVVNMGAYIFGRKAAGGESGTVTITTSGNEPTAVIWTRLRGADLVDDPNGLASAGADAATGGSTPTATTGTLAGTGEAVVALGALSNIGDAGQTSPIWTGPTAGTTVTNGTGSSGVRAYSALKIGAGTAAESASVAWSGTGAFNRYTLVATFTETAASGQDGAGTSASGSLSDSGSGSITYAGAGSSSSGALSDAGAGTQVYSGSGSSTSGSLSSAGTGTQPLAGTGSSSSGVLTSSGTGTGPVAGASGTPMSARLAALWFTETLGIERYQGDTAYGPSFAASVDASGALDHGTKEVLTATGDTVISTARCFLSVDTDTIRPGSRVTLPGAHGGGAFIVIGVQLHRSGQRTPDHLELVLQ